MRLLTALAVCGVGGLVIMTACSLAVDLDGLSSGGSGGTSSVGGAGGGGNGGLGGSGGGVVPTAPPLVPAEGSYVFKALTPGAVHGLVTDLSVDGTPVGEQLETRLAPDDPFLATVVHLDPADYDGGASPYTACWRITLAFRPRQAADPWSDSLDLCTRDGRLDIQLTNTVQHWTVGGGATETSNIIDCRLANGFVPSPLLKPSCEIPDADDCMEPQLSFFYTGCEGSNDALDESFTSGGRATWVQRAGEDTLRIGGAEVPAFHIIEERTIFDASAMSTVGILDPDHPELQNLGTRTHWWLHRETGMVLRMQREVKLLTNFSFDYLGVIFDGTTTYDEDWAYELTSLVAQPLPGGGGAGGMGGAGGAGGAGGMAGGGGAGGS